MKILLSKQMIASRVAEIGKLISRDYAGQKVIMIGVMKGSFIFLADLVRCIENVDIQIEFITASSYGDEQSSVGHVQLSNQTYRPYNLAGENVILVEDIIDTGLTIGKLINLLRLTDPKSLSVVALLDKPAARKHSAFSDYTGFTIPDKFVIGYGLDDASYQRNLPDIWVKL